MTEKKAKIETRDDFVFWVTEIYCQDCPHSDNCNMFYLCPPLDETWKALEIILAKKEAKE